MKMTLAVSFWLLLFMFSLSLSQEAKSVTGTDGRSKDTVLIATFPEIVFKPTIEFPPAAQEAGVAGKVLVKGLIDPSGNPVKTEIVKREPEMGYMFDDEARRFFMKCRFSPARDSTGRPVPCWASIPLNFRYPNFTPPVCEDVANPEYPEEALDMGLEGWVGIAVLVDATGSALNGKTAVVARYPSESRVFDEAARLAARASKFRPAEDRTGPVSGWCFVKITFSLPDH